jgi:hypothetical protein
VKVVACKSFLSALPTLAGIAGFEKSSSAGHEIEIFPAWRAADVVDIQIVDAAADILPATAAVQAADDPAMFQADMENLRFIWMDEDMAHMLSVWRARVAPLCFDLRGQILNARQFLPALAAVLAAVEMNRLDTT